VPWAAPVQRDGRDSSSRICEPVSMGGAGVEAAGGQETHPATRRGLFLRDVLLIVLTVAAGVVDAVSFLGLGQVFISNMTGNLVLLGIAAGQGSSGHVGHLAVALGSFLGGVFAAGWATRKPGVGVWPLGVRFALAAVLVLEAGFCVTWAITQGQPGPMLELVLTAVLGLAMGTQSAAVRTLAPSGMSTTFMTGTLVDLVRSVPSSTDERIGKARSLAVVASLAGGAAAGAVLFYVAPPLALVVAPGLVAVVLVVASLQARDGLATGDYATSAACAYRKTRSAVSPDPDSE
jgi:uncharacterized membrane protein YoaK (UPF0700 family)